MASLEQHINNPTYGRRYSEVLRLLSEQYQWDIEEVVSEEEELLSSIAVALVTTSLRTDQIAEQANRKLKTGDENLIVNEPTETIEPQRRYPSDPRPEGVGMFSQDYWELETEGLPWPRGGYAHSPTIKSNPSSIYYVPMWEKVRIYSLQHPEKRVKDVSDDLGVPQASVSSYLLGKEGKGRFAINHPDLDRIVPSQTTAVKRIEFTKRMFTGFGPDSTLDEKEIFQERSIELFKEKTRNETVAIADAIDEISEEFGISYGLVKEWIIEAGLYDREKSILEMGGKRSETLLGRVGTTQEDLEEYIRVFGQEASAQEVADALGVSGSAVNKARKKLGITPYETVEFAKESKRIKDYILLQNDYMTGKQMAEALNVHPGTVETHRKELGLVALGKQIGGLKKMRGGLGQSWVEKQPRYEEIKEYLLEHGGKIPDRDIEENLKISFRTLKAFREVLGIDKYQREYRKGFRGG